MKEKFPPEAERIMQERFGHDTLLSVATVDGEISYVRTVNAYYEDGAFYIITHGLSNKRKHIRKNSNVPYAATGLQHMVRAAIWGRSVKRKTEKSPTNYVLHFRRGSIMDIITLMMKTLVFSVFN